MIMNLEELLEWAGSPEGKEAIKRAEETRKAMESLRELSTYPPCTCQPPICPQHPFGRPPWPITITNYEPKYNWGGGVSHQC